MGEAKRRKLAGNTQPKPNWSQHMTNEQIRELVHTTVSNSFPGIVAMSQQMMEKHRSN